MSVPKDATLHRRILSDIEGNIVSGNWPPGHRIPFEVDLAAEYQCSRMTVNKVMTQLVANGLIERRKKGGSFVTQPHGQAAVLEINDIESDILALKLPYRYEFRGRVSRKSRVDDTQRIDVHGGKTIVELQCVHFAGARPFCFEDRIINADAVPAAKLANFQETPPGRWLMKQVPWSDAEHKIYAWSASSEVASELMIKTDSACLVVERRTWLSGKAITAVRFVYPGEAHSLIARFSPAS